MTTSGVNIISAYISVCMRVTETEQLGKKVVNQITQYMEGYSAEHV